MGLRAGAGGVAGAVAGRASDARGAVVTAAPAAGGAGGRKSGVALVPSSLPLLPNMIDYQFHCRDNHFFFSFSLPSRLPKPAFFFVLISLRPVSTCAISLIVWTIA